MHEWTKKVLKVKYISLQYYVSKLAIVQSRKQFVVKAFTVFPFMQAV